MSRFVVGTGDLQRGLNQNEAVVGLQATTGHLSCYGIVHAIIVRMVLSYGTAQYHRKEQTEDLEGGNRHRYEEKNYQLVLEESLVLFLTAFCIDFIRSELKLIAITLTAVTASDRDSVAIIGVTVNSATLEHPMYVVHEGRRILTLIAKH